MKKTYIIPQLSVMEFKAPNLCVISADGTKGSSSVYDTTMDAGDGLGREAEFDDDEY